MLRTALKMLFAKRKATETFHFQLSIFNLICWCGSMAEQLIRNEQVVSSILTTSSKLQGFKILKFIFFARVVGSVSESNCLREAEHNRDAIGGERSDYADSVHQLQKKHASACFFNEICPLGK